MTAEMHRCLGTKVQQDGRLRQACPLELATRPGSGLAPVKNAGLLAGVSIPADDGQDGAEDGQESQHESVRSIGLLNHMPL